MTTKPIVHTNGTSADRLFDQVIDAGHAIRKALDAVSEAAPNGRDYYLEPGLFQKAQSEHVDRVNKLQSVLEEYQELAEYLADYT